MIDNIVIEGFILLYMGSSIYLFFKEIDEVKRKEDFQKHMNKIYGGKIMFDKKEMKLVKFDQIRKYLANGEDVFMVMDDGQLVEMNINTDWQLLFFHQLRGGAFAVYRKKWNGLGTFSKDIHIGNWSFNISHKEKGGDDNVSASK